MRDRVIQSGMKPLSLVYTPGPGLVWLRVLVREFMIPRIHWARLVAGPALLAVGITGMVAAAPTKSPERKPPAVVASAPDDGAAVEEPPPDWFNTAGLNLMSSVLVGVGLGWSSWPLAAAGLSVLRHGHLRRRPTIRLTLTAGVIELVSGDSRRLFPLDEMKGQARLATGEYWLTFRGGRFLLVPAAVSEGNIDLFMSTVFAHETEAAPPPIQMAPGRLGAEARRPSA